MVCDRSWHTSKREALLQHPDRFIAAGRCLKAGNTATVAQAEIDGQDIVIKRYNIKTFSHFLRRCLRPSRAMTSWQNAHRLGMLGIATAPPLAVIEERWAILRRRAFFIAAFLPGDTIDEALRAKRNNPEALAHVLQQMEGLLAKLAAARISHGDFKATNLLCVGNQLYLVDLDGMRIHRNKSAFRQAFQRDLRRLQRNWVYDPCIYRKVSAMSHRLLQKCNLG
jgi:tRNA A-37 threonylcarbamoyl transferase component Bud32